MTLNICLWMVMFFDMRHFCDKKLVKWWAWLTKPLHDLLCEMIMYVMTKTRPHIFYDQLFVDWQTSWTMSDPTWQNWRDKMVNKRNGRRLELPRYSPVIYMDQAQQFSPFIFSLSILISYMGQAQHFRLLFLVCGLFGSIDSYLFFIRWTHQSDGS